MPSPVHTAPDPARIASVFDEARIVAEEITLKLFRTPLAVENKLASGFDPVTQADRDAERAIREIIARHFPDHAIVGEEWPDKAGTAPYTWVIDPIDGTRAFIAGVPVWGTLIGLLQDGAPIAGMMAQPFTGEIWTAMEGASAYRRGAYTSPLRTSNTTSLSAAKLTATTPQLFTSPQQKAVWDVMIDRTLQVRYGLDCYGYCLLASGQIDLVVEADLKNVDIAPLIPIIEAAGGVITTWDGGPATSGGDCVAAANRALHGEALEAIALARQAL